MSNRPIGAFENRTIDATELGEQQLFRQVNLVGLEWLLQDCPVLTLREGAALIEPGQPNRLLYLVLVGTLGVYEKEATGEPLAVIQKGECIGLMSLMDRQPCHVLVVAKQACRLLVIDEDRFLALVNSSGAIARNVLAMAMQYLRGKNAEAADRGRLAQRLQQHAHIDPVTGLYNQRWLDGVLERQIMRAGMDRKPLSLVAVALDGFADFREEFGQDVADHALATVGQTIAATIRPTDMLAYHGADCFVAVLPDTDDRGALLAEQRIRDTVAKTVIEIPGVCRLPPLQPVTGRVQMKAFVAARKLIQDALDALRNPDEADLRAGRVAAG